MPFASRIVTLIPDLASLGDEGGRQRHNRLLCMVLTEYSRAHDTALEIVSLRDPPDWCDPSYLDAPVIGCDGRRGRFAWAAAKAMARPHDLLILGVVDFGPLLFLRPPLKPRAPIITITHGIEVWKPLPYRERMALSQARRVLTVSAYTADRVAELHGVDRRSVAVVPIPLAPGFAAAASASEEGTPAPSGSRLLTISRMNRIDMNKGIDTVITALAKVRERMPDVDYTIIGEGDDRPRLEALVHRLGLEEIVHFVGRVSDAEVHAHLAESEVFVMPSRKEGFGIVFVEAMAYGKPVIAGAHGGSPEVVVDEETGVLVPHGDVHALAAQMERLLADSALRARMGATGRARAHQVFSFSRFQREINVLLDAVTNER